MYSLLEGVRVLDISRLIPGAYATAKLADLGADVIKIEQAPKGDYMRSQPPLVGDMSILYLALNRNKRSFLVDLDKPEERVAFEDLVRTADIFIEGARPGAMALIGCDYDSIRKLKPDIIYCSLSGYGQTGPYRMLPSHGANLEASAGFVEIQERPDGTSEAPNVRVFMASQSGGVHAALAMVAALENRRRTGEGAYLDVCGWDGAVSWMYGNLTSLANTGDLFPGSEGLGARYGAYRAKDGKWVMFAAIEPKFWLKFCKAVDRPELAAQVDLNKDTDFGSDNQEGLRAQLADVIAGRTQAEWVEFAIKEQLPLAPVLTPRDLLDNPHMQVREMLVKTPHPTTDDEVTLVALPIKVGGQEFEVRQPAPTLGQHNEEILGELRRARVVGA